MDSKERALKLLIVLSRANRSVHDTLQDNISIHGLNLSEFAVLELLYHRGTQTIHSIGEKILVPVGSTTYIVNQLAKKGFVNRRQNPEDKRIFFADISGRGKVFMEELFPQHAVEVEKLFNVLNEEEQETLIETLKKIGFSADATNH
ncbi:MarR family winged helix-turn-helix transcriptional regulator [Aureibacillus halotolerans]|uniref:MarR family transcriptional regulator n=1 Tax=Aureibacillus halotolerans TaxID=1508390 RepID=A0A4R6U9C8_9BACI|nr:MarR family transcriptional regulator [Aureibacillus halotolerans]TDQ41429.1 MarR family transcriptional regulator [Aureibacillus halotolerans]